MTTKAKPSKGGRPQEMAGGRRVNTYLDAASVALAVKLGNGNVSEGIRIAVKMAAMHDDSGKIAENVQNSEQFSKEFNKPAADKYNATRTAAQSRNPKRKA